MRFSARPSKPICGRLATSESSSARSVILAECTRPLPGRAVTGQRTGAPGRRRPGTRAREQRPAIDLVKQDIGQLTALVRTLLRRMQYRPGLLEGFLAKTRLDLTPHQ